MNVNWGTLDRLVDWALILSSFTILWAVLLYWSEGPGESLQ